MFTRKINGLAKLIRLVLSVLTVGACNPFPPDSYSLRGNRCPDCQGDVVAPLPHTPQLARYASCSEIETDVETSIRRQAEISRQRPQDESVSSDAAASTSAKASSAEAGSSSPTAAGAVSYTNIQESGIDESDFTKIGDHHIYVYQGRQVEVVDRDNLEHLGSIDLSGFDSVVLYAHGDHLVVVSGFNAITAREEATVRVFAAEQHKLPVRISDRIVAGRLVQSRTLGEKLILVTESSLPFVNSGSSNELPQVMTTMRGSSQGSNFQRLKLSENGSQVMGVDCSAVIRPSKAEYDLTMTIVASVDLAALNEKPLTTALLGGVEQIYMSSHNLYLASLESPTNIQSPEAVQAGERLIITKVALSDTEAPRATAIGAIAGRTKDQWAFKEYEASGTLAVATTTGQTFGTNPTALNHLFVLEQQGSSLVSAAATLDFAPGEDIRAVRYLGPIATVVTFKTTDPLFTFDLTDPKSPKVLGELKVPGFSSYLHPLSDTRLLGVGTDTEDMGSYAARKGLKLELFDTADYKNVTSLSSVILAGRQSVTEVSSDHHAFYFDSKLGLIGVPVTLYEGTNNSPLPNSWAPSFSGAIIYKNEDRVLTELARLTHGDLMPSAELDGYWSADLDDYCHDIHRIFTVDSRVITISHYGLKAHNPQNPSEVLKALRFPLDRLQPTPCVQERWMGDD